MIELDRDGAVFVLRLTGGASGENRIGADLLAAFARALDRVEAATGPAALVTTGSGRFYSSGLDLAGLADLGARAWDVVEGLHALLARFAQFPRVTVAALNGHAFAAGAMLAFAHDFRVLRADRGWICLPEVDLATGKPLTPEMFALLRARLEHRLLHDLLVTGRRLAASEALERGAIDSVAAADEVITRAVAMAAALADKDAATLVALRTGLRSARVRTCD